MEILLSSIIGAIVSLILSLIFEDQLTSLKKRFLRWLRTIFYRRKSPIPKAETFSIGKYTTSWLVIDGDGELEYTPATIRCRVENMPYTLPPEISALRDTIQKREARKKSKGENYQWNGPMYSLEKYARGRTIPEENLEITLTFRPSDYFTFQATITSLDTNLLTPPAVLTLRQKYLQGHELSNPIPFLSNGFGIALAVITKDKKLILTRRNTNIGVRPGQLDSSVVEGIQPILDRSNTYKGPDLYRTAIRGAQEELGIQLLQEDIHFLGFGLDTEYYQWGLLGIAYCSETIEQIREIRTRGIGGKWEVNQIEAIDINPKQILARLKENKIWSIGFVTVYYALTKEFGKDKIDTIAKEIFK
ncbi:MAG: hypothetical protein HUU38_12410 [Anaerolineales bacterium]|nr:hypothetical protein [Anaerolineales bacterium]